jgi:hypothetical protein
MAEFTFYGTDADQDRLLQVLFKVGGIGLIPYLKYETAKPLVFTKDGAAFRRVFGQERVFYITGPFSKAPVFMEQNPYNMGFYIDVFRGGPVLNITFFQAQAEKGIALIPSNSLVRQRVYWDDKLTIGMRPSPELEQGYRDLIKLLKTQLKRVKIKHEIWIGPEALELVQQRKAKFRYGDWIGV